MNCPYKWANSTDEEDDQTSSWESEPEGERMLKNPPAWRRMMKKESGAGLRRAELPDGEGELTHDRQLTMSLRKMNRYRGDWITYLTKRRRNSGDVKGGHDGNGLGSSREGDAEEHVSRDRDQTHREVQEWKRVQGTRGREHQELRATGHVRQDPEGAVRKSTWQVADVRRPLVSASHIIKAGNDLFIGKDEACIMNRKKKKKSMLRKEGNVYVLDLFVSVPSRKTGQQWDAEAQGPEHDGAYLEQVTCLR